MWVRIWVHNFEDKSYFRTCNDSEKKIANINKFNSLYSCTVHVLYYKV